MILDDLAADLAALKLLLTPASAHLEQAEALLASIKTTTLQAVQTQALLDHAQTLILTDTNALREELRLLREALVVPPVVVPPLSVPDAPTNLTAVAGDGTVRLTWDAMPRATSYLVLRRDAVQFRLLVVVTSPAHTDSTALNGTPYSYQVIASNLTGGSAISATVNATPTMPHPPTNGPRRIALADLMHERQFMLPEGLAGPSIYGGRALSFNKARLSFFLGGLLSDARISEVSNPVPGSQSVVLQALADATEGRMFQVQPSSLHAFRAPKRTGWKDGYVEIVVAGETYLTRPGPVPSEIDPHTRLRGFGAGPWVGGTLVTAGGKLIESIYDGYDGASSQTASHFSSGLDLTVQGDVVGPVRLAGAPVGWVSGYMGHIPAEFQEALGSPHFTGNCCLSIIERTSYGPCMWSFDGDDLTKPVKPLVGYPGSNPLGPYQGRDPYFLGVTRILGACFVPGTRTVAFFGRHTTGLCRYGTATYDRTKDGLPNSDFPGKQGDGTPYPWVYIDSGEGTEGQLGIWADPMVNWVWLYDVLDLIEVAQGRQPIHYPRPYEAGSLPGLPNTIRGACTDDAGRIYVSVPNLVIHVFTVKAA